MKRNEGIPGKKIEKPREISVEKKYRKLGP